MTHILADHPQYMAVMALINSTHGEKGKEYAEIMTVLATLHVLMMGMREQMTTMSEEQKATMGDAILNAGAFMEARVGTILGLDKPARSTIVNQVLDMVQNTMAMVPNADEPKH